MEAGRGKGAGRGGKGGRGRSQGGRGAATASGRGSGNNEGRGGGPKRDERKKAKKASRKNQIRSLERLLKREGLDASMKAELTKKLKALEGEVEGKSKEDLEKKRSLRYRKVKFFERRKIDRKLDAARKRLAVATETSSSSSSSDPGKLTADEASALRSELAQLEADRIYVKYYPKDKKYISLFNPVDEKTAARRVSMRELAATAAQTELRDKTARKRRRNEGSDSDDSRESASSIESDDFDDNGEDDEDGDDGPEDDDFFIAADEKAPGFEKATESQGSAKKTKRLD